MKRIVFALGLVAMLSLSATAFAEGMSPPADGKSAPAKEKKKDGKKRDEKKDEKKEEKAK